MVFRISKIHTNADFTFSNNNKKLKIHLYFSSYKIIIIIGGKLDVLIFSLSLIKTKLKLMEG